MIVRFRNLYEKIILKVFRGGNTKKVEKFRKQLLEKESQREEVVDFEFDESGRPV